MLQIPNTLFLCVGKNSSKRMENRKIIFNHNYVLKHDLKRTYIYTRENADISDGGTSEKWFTKIHPIYAMLFSLASKPIHILELIKEVSFFFDLEENKAETLITNLCEKETPFYSEFDGVVSQFPKNVLIDANTHTDYISLYKPEEFVFNSVDLSQERSFLTPMTAVLMPNSDCSTDCIYCYADRRKQAQMPLEKIEAFIRECKDERIMKILITGGDIFRYKEWRKILVCLRDNGFKVGLLSTKTPIKKEDAVYIKEYDGRLQFSLDSADPTILKRLWNVSENYFNKIKQCFHEIEDSGLKFRVATVLTNINCSPEMIEELYRFISQFKSINSWTIRVALKSLYSKSNFEDLKLSPTAYEAVNEKIEQLKNDSNIEISWDGVDTKHYFKGDNGSKSFTGARCSANYSNIMILPDGKVTICEQLYWNPKYIIGNINVQSIREIWNSPEALNLAFPKQKAFRPESPCAKCKIFDECYSFPNRCIVDVLKGYGEKNDDYPDPRCNKAPHFINNLTPIKDE